MITFKNAGKKVMGFLVAGAVVVSATLNVNTSKAQASAEENKVSYCLEGYGTGNAINPDNWTLTTSYDDNKTIADYKADEYKAAIVANRHSEEKESVIRLINGLENEDMSAVSDGKDARSGMAVMKQDFTLNNTSQFSAKFTVSMPDACRYDGYGKEPGGDGIVFIIAKENSLTGATGGGIGYKGITGSIGIELDSFYNTGNGMDYKDPDVTVENGIRRDHIAVVANGANTTKTSHIATSFLCQNGYEEGFTESGNLATAGEEMDTRLFTVWVEYNGSNLEVRYAKGDFVTAVRPEAAQISVDAMANEALKAQLNSFAGSNVNIGFTAGIGSSKANHTVHSVAFANQYMEDGIQLATYTENYYVESPDATDNYVEVNGKKYVLAKTNEIANILVGKTVKITDLENEYIDEYVVVDYSEMGYPSAAEVLADGTAVVNQFFDLVEEETSEETTEDTTEDTTDSSSEGTTEGTTEETTEGTTEETTEEEENIEVEVPEAAPSVDEEEETTEKTTEETVVVDEEEEEDIEIDIPEAAPSIDGNTKTGDSSNLTIIFVVMLISGLGVLVASKKRKMA